ncbi:hypothetical protein ACFW1M_43750 [Streptomyces inhibens]|uniref:hypothetical protein n=1 Tax=Streptomyces inhibens TaxID=2293571 RepID=UPI00369D4D5C
MGPRQACITVLGLGGGIFLAATGVLRADTQLTGLAGEFRAERCEVSHSRHGDDGWLCSGTFEAADHGFRTARVEVDTVFDQRPTGPVAALVDEPSSTTAVRDDARGWLLPGGTGLLCLGVAGWNIRSAFRRPRQA